jgi:hypothetical protein
MKKIPTIFKRDPNNPKLITQEPHPECHWVFLGEGAATRKYDGTCCLIEQNRKLYKRREIKPRQHTPNGFFLADYDQNTDTKIGWVPVSPDNKEDKWHLASFHPPYADGTYELVGPKIQGNPENYATHTLIAHADAETYPNVPRTFDGLKEWLKNKDIEGLVFHHPDGRMAKIKKRDFQLPRKSTQEQ